MQNRISSLVSLLTLLVSYYAYDLSNDVYAEAEEYAQRFENTVGLSPSPVQPREQEGQDLIADRENIGEGKKQVSQGGKQESLPKASSIDGVSAESNEAVAEPVQFDAPAKPVRRSTKIYKRVDNTGNVHFSDQRKGELVKLGDSVSFVDTSALRAATETRREVIQKVTDSI